MGFLEDFGRSDAFKVGQVLLDDTMRVGQQERQGLLGELQARDQMERTAIFQAEEERRAKESAIKTKADDDTRKWLRSPFNIKASPLLPSPDDETYQEKFNKLRGMTEANELGITTNEGMLRAAKLMKETPEAMKEWYKPRLDKIENAINDTDKKIFEADVAGKTDKVRELKATRERLNAMLLQKTGQYDKWLLEGKKQEGREEIANIKTDMAEKIATIRAETAKDVADRRLEAAKEREARAKDTETRAKEGKELQKRNATHKEVEKIFGISEFLESAKDPELRRNYGEVAAFSDEISRNPVGYGLKEKAGEAEIAKKAYDIWAMMKGKKPLGNSGSKPPISSFGGK